jgi:hypothetical protein
MNTQQTPDPQRQRSTHGTPQADTREPVSWQDWESKLGITIRVENSEQDRGQTKMANPEELSQVFALSFAAALDQCRRFAITSGLSGVPQVLKEVVSDETKRSQAWMMLAASGLPAHLNVAQGHALMVALLPHLIYDGPAAQAAVCRLASQAASRRDYALYKILGDACSGASIHPLFVAILATSFCQLSSHNVEMDAPLRVWSNFFSAQADEKALFMIADQLRSRIVDGQFSSYDHLLTALSNSRDPAGLKMLDRLARPVNPPPGDAPTERGSWLKSCGLFLVRHSVPISMIFVMTVVADMAIVPAVGMIIATAVAMTGGILWARRIVLDQRATETRETAARIEHEFFGGEPHRHFAERLYEKLMKLPSTNPAVAGLRKYMDETPRYAHLKQEIAP